jgi:uncharacterized protein
MRRSEFEITDQREIYSFLSENSTGVLSLINKDNHPYSVPLNYVFFNKHIYFHCAADGTKIKAINHDKNAQFTVFREYSFIPSYATGTRNPCSASTFFKSVFISGTVETVDDSGEKAAVMNAFMKSFQPEEGYLPLSGDAHHGKMLEAVSVYKLAGKKVSAKFKFGQQLTNAVRQMIIDVLEKRGAPLDLETVDEIRRFSPVK